MLKKLGDWPSASRQSYFLNLTTNIAVNLIFLCLIGAKNREG